MASIQAALTVEEGDLKGLSLTLDEVSPEFTLGRDPSCELVVEDPRISRKHALFRKKNASFEIENLSAINPLEVNGAALEGPHLLTDGDTIKIGGQLFLYSLKQESETSRAEPLEENEPLEEIPFSEEALSETPSAREPAPLAQSLEIEEEEAPATTKASKRPRRSKKSTPSDSSFSDDSASENSIPDADENSEEGPSLEELLEENAEEEEYERAEAEEAESQRANILKEDETEPASELAEIAKEDTPPFEKPQEDPSHEDISIFEEHREEGAYRGTEVHFDLHESSRWLLKVISGPSTGAEFPMQEGATYVVGTDPGGCDVLFHDTSVSRQHARIEVSGETVEIEDLGSKNGTYADGERIQGKKEVSPSTVISLGTTSFVVYDREKEMQTIIAPLLPSIVKVLQGDEKKEGEKPKNEETLQSQDGGYIPQAHARKDNAGPAFIIIGIIVGLFTLIGFGAMTLFRTEPIAMEAAADIDARLADVMKNYPGIKYSYNHASNILLLVGHVSTGSEKQQLIYALQGLRSIANVDDNGLIIDEYVWKEMNVVLARNPNWRGISMHSPQAGLFVLTGYLSTRKQAEDLSNYMTSNFPYIELLEKKIIVEEDLTNSVTAALQTRGFKDIKVQMAAGELTLTGTYPAGKKAEYDGMLDELRQVSGIRVIKNFVNELAPELSVINITDKYQVSGYSASGSRISVVINGRILSKGDVLDGMVITSIRPNVILLEKENVKYRIDFNK